MPGVYSPILFMLFDRQVQKKFIYYILAEVRSRPRGIIYNIPFSHLNVIFHTVDMKPLRGTFIHLYESSS